MKTDYFADAAQTVPEGDTASGVYPRYDALWHLNTIGVLGPDNAAPGWDLAEKRLGKGKDKARTRVAVIDTSVACGHPNLVDAIRTDLMIDFFSARLGAFPVAPKGSFKKAVRKNAHTGKGSKKTFTSDNGHVMALYNELGARLDDLSGDANPPVKPATSDSFSAHGTALAGLIGARPAMGTFHPSSTGGAGKKGKKAKPQPVPMPYVGVDPFADIVPVSTSFDPDPEQLILALLYAEKIKADIIVLARDIPDPFRATTASDAPPEELAAIEAIQRVTPSAREAALWDALHDLLVEMAGRRLVVCAAGNTADDSLAYPARLAETCGIIAVGAQTASGDPASYSNSGARGAPVTVHAPSGDGERVDEGLVAFDRRAAGFEPEEAAPVMAAAEESGATVSREVDFRDIVSTDIPGRAGYNGGVARRAYDDEGNIFDFGSFYCRFSGTSAATAITAGFLSLAISSGKLTRGDATAARRSLGVSLSPTGTQIAPGHLAWANVSAL